MKTLYKLALACAVLLFSANYGFAQTNAERDRGIAFYNQGDFKSAVKILKSVAKSSASDALAWYYLGLSQAKDGKLKDAEKSLKKAVDLDDQNADFHAALGYLYLMRNDLPKARNEAEDALRANPNSAEAHYIYGVTNFRYSSFDSSYERAKAAIKANPNFAPAYLLKSESLVSSFAIQTGTVINPKSNRYELLNEAAADLEKYLSLTPAGADTEFQREYLESLKFFAGYYSKPENQVPKGFDVNAETDNTRTGVVIISKPRANYTDAARQAVVTGAIRLLVNFSESGRVEHILVIKSLGYGLNEEAIRAARGIKFTPATKDGRPVPSVKMVEYTFSIY